MVALSTCMLKLAFFFHGKALNLFCSILPSTCPFNKSIRTKNNVGEKKIKEQGGNKKISFGLTQPLSAPWTGGRTRLRTSRKCQELFKFTLQQRKDLTPNPPSQTHMWSSVAAPFTAFLSIYILTGWSQHSKEQTSPFNMISKLSEPAKIKRLCFLKSSSTSLGKGMSLSQNFSTGL